jgi:hypothetical protein
LKVGARWDDDAKIDSGSVHVFVKDGDDRAWTHHARFVALGGGGAEEYFSFTIPVGCTPYLMNSTRLHKVFQNFLVPWKIQMV